MRFDEGNYAIYYLKHTFTCVVSDTFLDSLPPLVSSVLRNDLDLIFGMSC